MPDNADSVGGEIEYCQTLMNHLRWISDWDRKEDGPPGTMTEATKDFS